MKILCGVLGIVILGCLGIRCDADISKQWQVPDWNQVEKACQCDEKLQIQGQHEPSLRRSRPTSDFDSDALNCLSEMNRLFYIPPEEDVPNAGLFLTKAVFALPLLRKGNVMEITMRPQRNLYLTLVKRLMLYEFKSGTRVQPSEGMTAIDTHVHTCHSPDSLASVSEMLKSAARHGLNGVAITDHNSFEGAAEALKVVKKLVRNGEVPATFFVIPGEEISSSDGHIIGLFLTGAILSGRSAEWTIKAIHQQGGIAIAAHPLLPHSLGELAKSLPFDAVETENSAEKLHYVLASREEGIRRAQFYDSVVKPRIGSSDAHDPQVVGECYTMVRCAPTPEAVRIAMLRGDVTPVAVSDADMRSMTRHGLPNILALFETVSDLSPLVKKITGHNDIDLKLLPRPSVFFSKRF